MNKPILIYKKIGETPLMALDRIRKENPVLADLPMTYAGRLDPLAEGLLIVLVGESRMEKDKYLALSKEYEMEILFGFETDTYDLLGRVSKPIASRDYKNLSGFTLSGGGSDTDKDFHNPASPVFLDYIEKIFKKFIGNIDQKYPPYSSKPVKGKPLFQWAREGKLGEIEIPTHTVSIKSIDIIDQRKMDKENLQIYIKNTILKVSGDFRQEEILNKWEQVLSENKNKVFDIIKIKVLCGSGTYMRTLAHDIGKSIGTPALAFSIKRTKIGDYKI